MHVNARVCTKQLPNVHSVRTVRGVNPLWPTTNPDVRIKGVEVLSDAWYTLRRVEFDHRTRGGEWSTQQREAYDRGNGATVLLVDWQRGTVLLTRQFRVPAYLNEHPDGMLIEAPAGLLDDDDAETAIRREAEEETGCRVNTVTPLFELFMSPGSVTERVAFFVAEYEPFQRVTSGGGVADEGEDIEVIEMTLAEAVAAVATGDIVDGKTVLLLQWAQLRAALGPDTVADFAASSESA
jgi:nudix-type nucleoside diphosphatase (YffH/AdpP family)